MDLATRCALAFAAEPGDGSGGYPTDNTHGP